METSETPPSLPESPGPAGELVVQNGRLSGTRRPLSSPVTLIGQSPGCHVRLNVEGVSALHCAILDDPRGPILRDLDTDAGTVVNGQRVATRRLVHGDTIEIGPFQFSISLAAPLPAEAPCPEPLLPCAEHEALLIQAAAVAAQQAELMEEEGRLQQRETALERQEGQLASHLEDRHRGLDEAEELLARERVAFQEECAALREALQSERRDVEQLRIEALKDHQKAGQERQRVKELRRRLRKRWRNHWDAQEARMKKREAEAAAGQERLQRERAKVVAFQERTNSELELGRQQLRAEWQELGLAQQGWEGTLNHEQAEQARRHRALQERADEVAAAEQALASDRRRFDQYHAALVKEIEGLEARIANQRLRLEALQQEAARQEKIPGAPAGAGAALTLSPPVEPARAAEQWPDRVRDLAGTLGDQRLHLMEQWEKLLQVQDNWQQERRAVLAELETMTDRLTRREGELLANQRIFEAECEEVRRQKEGLSLARSSLEGWQARLTVQETTWLSQRDALLKQIELREQALEVRRRQLEDVHQRRNRRRRQEVEEFQAALARCDEARRQHSALWQDCERLRETLVQQERTLSSRALALERFRLEAITRAADSARAESKLELLSRRDGARLDAEARDLALERRKLLHERLRLDEQAARLNQLEEELLIRQRECSARIAEWENQRAPLEEEDERREQEVRRLRAFHALDERQLRQLRDEIERLARVMIEEADDPAAGQQAA